MPPEKLLWQLASVAIRDRLFKQLLFGVLPAVGKVADRSVKQLLFGVLPAVGKLAPLTAGELLSEQFDFFCTYYISLINKSSIACGICAEDNHVQTNYSRCSEDNHVQSSYSRCSRSSCNENHCKIQFSSFSSFSQHMWLGYVQKTTMCNPVIPDVPDLLITAAACLLKN